MVYPEGYHYIGLSAADIPFLVEEQFLKGRALKNFWHPHQRKGAGTSCTHIPKEVRVVLRNCGKDQTRKTSKNTLQKRVCSPCESTYGVYAG
jgi:hypothetical protein